MTDQQAPAPTLPNGTALADLSGVQATSALIRAVEICATKAAGDDRAAEVKDYGAAALAFAQTAITLDPSRLGAGATPAAQVNAMPPQAPPTPKLPPTKDGNRNGVIGG
jgi:predicted NBD/HSP70 family sugar kinase